jgi:hypothetical protein
MALFTALRRVTGLPVTFGGLVAVGGGTEPVRRLGFLP